MGTTGIAGLTLGGGIGYLDRLAGLTCDNLLEAEIVTADGRVLRADGDAHPGVGVLVTLRRRGLGGRLLTGALTLLRAEGFARLHASATSGGAGASLLASAGFAADGGAARAGGCSRFALVL